MSTSIDAEFTNALERALNTDENLTETLIGRTIAEAARAFSGSPTFYGYQLLAGVDNTLFDMETRTQVFGLAISVIDGAPREFTIAAGVVVTNDGAEAPTADDSPVRIGIVPNGTTVQVPYPASDDLWHLLECRVVNVNVTEARDILTNPVTRTYAPQNVVKRKLKRLEFQITTGTGSDIPAADAGWVPLYGFVIPTAGAAIPVMSQVVDLRPSSVRTAPRAGIPAGNPPLFYGVSRILSHRLATVSTLGAPGSSQLAQFDFTAQLDGLTLHAHSVGAGVDLTRFLVGGGAPAAATWHYIYLAPLPMGATTGNVGNACWGGRQEPVVSNCLLLVSSTVVPRKDGRNSAQLTPNVAPFAGTLTVIGGAICVGVIYQTDTGTGWDPTYVSKDGHVKIGSADAIHLFQPAAVGAQAISVTSGVVLPVNMIRHLDLQFGMVIRSTTQAAGGVGGHFLVTPGRVDAVAVNDARSFGSVVVDPLIQEDYASITVPAVDDDLVAPGTITYKVETRDANGVAYGVNGLINQVASDGAAYLKCRVTGFQL